MRCKHSEFGCREIAENFLKQGETLRKDFEFSKETYKKCHDEKYHILNEILYKRHGKCTSSNIYPDGSLLQEEAIEIKRILNKDELNDFITSNAWLESWKKTYGVREKRLCGEADDVSTTTIETWIERLPELCQG